MLPNLAGIGASYAGFVDIITIEGTVNTGTVDLQAVAFSGTWVYKVTEVTKTGVIEEAHNLVIHHDWVDVDGEPITAEIAGKNKEVLPPMSDPDLPVDTYSYQRNAD